MPILNAKNLLGKWAMLPVSRLQGAGAASQLQELPWWQHSPLLRPAGQQVWWWLPWVCWSPLKAELFLSFSKALEESSAHGPSLVLGDKEAARLFPFPKPSWVPVMTHFGCRCSGIQECPRGQPTVALTWKKTQPNCRRRSLGGHWCGQSPLLPFCRVGGTR